MTVLRKYWLKIAFASILPLILYLVLAEKASWRPRILRHSVSVCSVAFSPDNKTIAVGHGSGAITLWNVDSGMRVKSLGNTLSYGEHQFQRLAFSSSGELLAIGSGDDVSWWNMKSGKRSAEYYGTWQVADLCFSSDEKTLTTVKMNMDDAPTLVDIIKWNVKAGVGQEGQYQAKGLLTSQRSVALLPGGDVLVIASHRGIELIDLNTIASLQNGPHSKQKKTQKIQQLPQPLATVIADSIRLSPRGDALVTWESQTSKLKIWNTDSWRLLNTIPMAGKFDVTTYTLSPDAQLLACGVHNYSSPNSSPHGTIYIVDTQTGKTVRTIVEDMPLTAELAFSGDSTTLATSNLDGTAKLYRVQ